MPETCNPNSDFDKAIRDAKKEASGVAGKASDAAQDLYGQAVDSASQIAGATHKSGTEDRRFV